MDRDAQLILVAGGLLAAGVVASLVARRIRVPALVLFLGVGLAIGTDGLGWIDFEDYPLARLIGSIALVLILYEGGLAAGFRRMRPVLATAISLATVATIVTALLAGLAASVLFDFSVKEGLLVGAILSATDGAAVFALMRGARMPSRLAHTLEGEAGFNDPVAVLPVLVMIKLVQHGTTRPARRSGSSRVSLSSAPRSERLWAGSPGTRSHARARCRLRYRWSHRSPWRRSHSAARCYSKAPDSWPCTSPG